VPDPAGGLGRSKGTDAGVPAVVRSRLTPQASRRARLHVLAPAAQMYWTGWGSSARRAVGARNDMVGRKKVVHGIHQLCVVGQTLFFVVAAATFSVILYSDRTISPHHLQHVRAVRAATRDPRTLLEHGTLLAIPNPCSGSTQTTQH
jgi:hypothetical protein